MKGGLQYDRFLSYSASLGQVAPKPVCLYKKIARGRSYSRSTVVQSNGTAKLGLCTGGEETDEKRISDAIWTN